MNIMIYPPCECQIAVNYLLTYLKVQIVRTTVKWFRFGWSGCSRSLVDIVTVAWISFCISALLPLPLPSLSLLGPFMQINTSVEVLIGLWIGSLLSVCTRRAVFDRVQVGVE